MPDHRPFANTVAAGTLPARMRAELRVAVFGLAVVAALPMAAGVAFGRVQWTRVRDAHFVDAEVVAREPEHPAHVVVRYADRSGAVATGTLFDEAGATPPGIGEIVSVMVQGATSTVARDDRRLRWVLPAALIVFGVALPLCGLVFLRRRFRAQEARYTTLQQFGTRQPVAALRTAQVTRKGNHRWGAIASWRGRAAQYDTVVAGFDYDPASLLRPADVVVLTDGADASRAIVDPATLPSCFRRELPDAQRAIVDAVAPVPLADRLAVAAFVVGAVALLAFGLYRTFGG